MADKGFLIQDLLKAKNAGLVIPPFIGAKRKLSKNEVSMTHNIARLEIHVERANRRVKGIPHLWRCYSTESCTIHPPNMDSVCYSDKFLRTVTLRKLLELYQILCISILFNSQEFSCICILKFNEYMSYECILKMPILSNLLNMYPYKDKYNFNYLVCSLYWNLKK